MTKTSEIRYKITVTFDDGVFEVRRGKWVQVGPAPPPRTMDWRSWWGDIGGAVIVSDPT